MPFVDDHNYEHGSADVFLSGSHADREITRKLAVKLSDSGFSIFHTGLGLKPGVDWQRLINHYLQNSSTILVCWSQNAVNSDYVVAEAEYARTNRLLVSAKISQCELMPPFNTFQTADLTDWKGEDEHATWRSLHELLIHRRTGAIKPFRQL